MKKNIMNNKGSGRKGKRLYGGKERRDDTHRAPIIRYTPDVFGFPDRLLTKLRYHDVLDLTSTAGVLVQTGFRWNSTFDPDYTNVGHQPMYRDTYAGIYDQYAVVRAAARITFTSKVASDVMFVSVNTDDDTAWASTVNQIAEQSHAVSTTLAPLSAGASQHTFNISWDCQRILNIDPFSSELYKTAVGSNPTEVSFLVCSIAGLAGATGTVTMEIVLEQEVLWTELSTQSIS